MHLVSDELPSGIKIRVLENGKKWKEQFLQDADLFYEDM